MKIETLLNGRVGMMGCLGPLVAVVVLALLFTAVAATLHSAKNACGTSCAGVQAAS